MVGFLDVEEVEKNLASCRLYTRRHARTFYFASFMLPKEKRFAAYAVYAFCRYADDVVDAAFGAHPASRRLDELRDQVRYLYQGSALMDPQLIGLRDVVLRYRIPDHYVLDLIRGVEMDLTTHRYATFDELLEYCYCVASVVGLMMTHVFGASSLDEARGPAAELGVGMQLTNILRDVRQDLSMGRIYLPAEDLARFDVSEEDLRHGVMSPGLRELMRFESDRARGYYARAARGIGLLSDDGSRYCVQVMSDCYAAILDVLERRSHDIFAGRAHVSGLRKLGLAASGLLRARRPHPSAVRAPAGMSTREDARLIAMPFRTSLPSETR